jgi:hypothetical protein
VDREPGVLGVLGRSHLDGELKLVRECLRRRQRFASLRFGRLALAQELLEGGQFAAQGVQALGRLQPLLEAPGLAENGLGLLLA